MAALAALAACGESMTSAPSLSPSDRPALGVSEPLNGADGACLATDAFLSGAVNGVNDDQDLADPDQNCEANDISIATADVLEYSLDGNVFIPYTPGAIACNDGDNIFVRLNAHVKENAESERTDIGVWIATDGGNARTGECNHYNLIAPAFDGTAPYSPVDGVVNIDNDSCGDMVDQDEAVVELGVITAKCEAIGTSTKVHIGSCVSWTQPGGDQVCPQTGVADVNNSFRWGTVPGTTSKCNCDGFDIDITVNQTALLEVVKACTPSNDGGTFDLLIDGSNANANDVACGGTTGAQEVTAGTNVLPGAVHSFGEGGFTTANYTSSYSCVNRDGTGPQHVFTASGDAGATGSSLGPNQITMLPGEDVVCTYTNVRKASITIEKVTAPSSDPQDFSFTVAGTGLSNFTLDTDGSDGTYSNTITFNNLTPGTGYEVTEDGETGWDLTNLVCSAGGVTDLASSKATITLAAGANVTCTFTNTAEGSITITKVTLPASHEQDFAFTTTGTGLTNFTLDTDAGNADFPNTKTFLGLSPGAYTVTESAVSGWDLTNLVCGTGGSPNLGTRTATINLPAGGSITCTFTNTQRASLTLNKVENGGLPLSRAWEFQLRTGTSTTQAGTLVASASANVTTGVITFPGTFAPGAYNLCEVGMPAIWTNNFTGYTPLGATPEGGDNSTECIDITLVSGSNGPGGITGVPNPIDNVLPPPPGGSARTIGYWKNWSSCTGGKQYIKAGERNELNKTLDYYLPAGSALYPIGDITGVIGSATPPLTCLQAVRLLGKSDMNSGKKLASDPAYNLAAQFIAAKLNYAAGAGQCAAATTALASAQTLLDAIGFTGTGTYKSSMTALQISTANSLASTLDQYNNNTLCP